MEELSGAEAAKLVAHLTGQRAPEAGESIPEFEEVLMDEEGEEILNNNEDKDGDQPEDMDEGSEESEDSEDAVLSHIEGTFCSAGVHPIRLSRSAFHFHFRGRGRI